MKVLVITSSPNRNGLTAECASAAGQGVEAAGGEAIMVRLSDLDISRCRACNRGWGTCGQDHECQMKDDFQALQAMVGDAGGFIVVTPVYWWDMSEPAKAFFDRLRRCEAGAIPNNVRGKPFVCVAAAGGTGHGTLSCLSNMEKLFLHLNGVDYRGINKFDYIGVTRRNKSYMVGAVRASAEKMVADG